MKVKLKTKVSAKREGRKVTITAVSDISEFTDPEGRDKVIQAIGDGMADAVSELTREQ